MQNLDFCTCKDKKCPNHPSNNAGSCSRCVLKCLTANEIPSCFFNKLGKEKKGDGYTFEDFAKTVLDK